MKNTKLDTKWIESYNCLLEEVFVPDMTDRQQMNSMQSRLRDIEPEEDWRGATRYDTLYTSPYQLYAE